MTKARESFRLTRLPVELQLQILDHLIPETASIDFQDRLKVCPCTEASIPSRCLCLRRKSSAIAVSSQVSKAVNIAQALLPTENDLSRRVDRNIARMLLYALNEILKDPERDPVETCHWLFLSVAMINKFAHSPEGLKATLIHKSLHFIDLYPSHYPDAFLYPHHYNYCWATSTYLESLIGKLTLDELESFKEDYGFLLEGFASIQELIYPLVEHLKVILRRESRPDSK